MPILNCLFLQQYYLAEEIYQILIFYPTMWRIDCDQENHYQFYMCICYPIFLQVSIYVDDFDVFAFFNFVASQMDLVRSNPNCNHHKDYFLLLLYRLKQFYFQIENGKIVCFQIAMQKISLVKDCYYKMSFGSSLAMLIIFKDNELLLLSLNAIIYLTMIIRNLKHSRIINLINRHNTACLCITKSYSTSTEAGKHLVKRLTLLNYHNFAKTSKKQSERQQKAKQKEKIKQSIEDVSTIDLNKFEESFHEVIQSFKSQIDSIKVGKLDKSSFSNIYIKLHNESFTIADLAQIAPQSVNTCIISPYDTQHLDLIDKAIRIHQSSYQVTKKDRSIIITQPQTSMKQFKEKMVVKVKKMSNDCRQKLSKERHKSQQQLKKFKKIIPQQRYKVAEKQLKQIYEKVSEELEKMTKQKQKELSK